MPRGLRNWTYRDVVELLGTYGFEFSYQREGSHEAWLNHDTRKVVEINFHASKSFPIRTLETMIRQSGLSKKVWSDWTRRKK